MTSSRMRLCGFIPDLANLRDYQWQGKIHSQIVEGPDGAMYFTTDGGESREEYLMDHPHGYSGGFFMKWDPASERLTNLGIGMRYESIKDLAVDQIDGKICAVSYPQVHFLTYDSKANRLHDFGRLGSDHVPRVLFRDWWSNVYYVDWRQRLVKYERDTGSLVSARESLPSFEGAPGESIITGITSYAVDRPAGIIYLVTFTAPRSWPFGQPSRGLDQSKTWEESSTEPSGPPGIITAQIWRWEETVSSTTSSADMECMRRRAKALY